jgi:hypothetical protein
LFTPVLESTPSPRLSLAYDVDFFLFCGLLLDVLEELCLVLELPGQDRWGRDKGLDQLK